MTHRRYSLNRATSYRGLAVAALLVTAVVVATLITPTLALDRDPASERVERGKYLVTVGGCHDCHTPWKLGDKGPEPDMTRMLSGHPQGFPMPPAPLAQDSPWIGAMAATNTAFAGPWGVSFTANLTPDEDTGIGAWNEEIFMNTLRTGRHWGQGRPILPPMPWFNYGKMTDEDLKAVFAYLRTMPPVKNNVPMPIPPGGPEVIDPWAD